MKVVHVITRLILGGAQENTILTCEGLTERGHEVTLITGPTEGPEGDLLERARNGGYELIEIPELVRPIRPWTDLQAYRHLRRLLGELDPDIVHTHSAKGGVLGRYAAWSLRKEVAKACCSKLEKVEQAKVVLRGRPGVVHTIHGLSFHPFQSVRLNRLYVAAEKRAAVRCDVLISVAAAMTEQSLAAGVGQESQYVKIFSGMEVEQYLSTPSPEQIADTRAQLGIPDEAVVIAKVARLFELKGHEYVIEAARRLQDKYPQVVWLFIGDGSWRERIEKQIAEAGLSDQFVLTGLVRPERIGPLLQASDALVHCSLREGLARALPQALLCGKPAVSFDVDGAREIVRNGETGYLVEARDVDGLTGALEKVIGDPEGQRRMGLAGRELCRETFDHRMMVEQIERVYEALV